ncbi:Peptidase S9 [Macleaya cordata]|uniref:Peptidase S9 n=1 Tax=Macleaya cordata TaxID=56857 RepID=A0A200PNL2_MACCD|nr:Peptidase S9 [Macleaya cordata]
MAISWAVTKLTSRATLACISSAGLNLNINRFCFCFSSSNSITSVSIKRNPQQCCSKRMSSSMASSAPPPAATDDGGGVKVDKKVTTAPYGSWKSPITADVVSGADKRLGGIAVDGHGHLLWVESRPNESGRAVLVKEAEKPGDEEPIDITPKEFAVRTLAQEYGGQAFAVSRDTIIFSNYKDQRLYKQLIGGSFPVPITPDYGGPVVRYADGVFDSRFKWYITVREDHRESSLNPTTTIVAVSLNGEPNQESKVLVGGNDFYAFPRMDPKGERLAWVEWGHPNMHWDKAELWVGYISEDGDVYKRICIAGGDPSLVESPSEPKWSSKGELFFVTDRKNGFWNLYKWIEHKNEVVPIYSMDAEFTRPFWVFGVYSYDFIQSNENNNLIACSYRQNGRSYLGILDDAQNSLTLLDVPFTDVKNIVSGGNCIYVEGASAIHPLSVAKVTLDDRKSATVDFSIIWSSSPDSTKYRSYFSTPEPIEFPTEVAGQKAYAYFYPPSNPIYQSSPEEKPPLLLKSHGGPTAESRGILDLNIQYWTSRGWAFVDVNYGGSTGYGREYRERLLGSWGIVDVNDCCSCARFLVESGKVDGERLCITGRSAGGYTTLASLAFRQTFKAGASLYGIADLNSLRAETHKFESHYISNLVGSEDAFFERSPINFVDKFSCPVILFQGLDDKVVTPGQARKIYMALKQKGLPVALVEYEGEQHGFRKAENIKFTLEQQMVFFARLIGNFKVADEISPIKIDNVD